MLQARRGSELDGAAVISDNIHAKVTLSGSANEEGETARWIVQIQAGKTDPGVRASSRVVENWTPDSCSVKDVRGPSSPWDTNNKKHIIIINK